MVVPSAHLKYIIRREKEFVAVAIEMRDAVEHTRLHCVHILGCEYHMCHEWSHAVAKHHGHIDTRGVVSEIVLPRSGTLFLYVSGR